MNKPHSTSIHTPSVHIPEAHTHSIIYGTIGMSGFVTFLLFIFGFSLLTSLPTRADAAVTVKTATTSSSLVGWWTFDDASSTKATDFSGYGNTGAISCGGVGCTIPTFISGKRGKALDFSANGVYQGIVSLPPTVPAASANRLTVSVWYYNKGGGGDPRIINRNWCSAGAWLMHVTLGFGVAAPGGCAGQIFASFGAMNAGQWYLLTGVFDGTNIYSYKNGVRISTSAAGTVDISANVAGLAMMTGNNGYLDDVRIYNKAFSAAEVAALYRSGQVTLTAPNKSGLVSYWPFNEGTSTSAGDFSGSRNNFTLVNFATVASSTSGWNGGKRGGALTFDGIDDYANINQPNIQTAPNVFTISGWIYPENQYARFLTPDANGIDNWVGYDATNQRLELVITEIADVNARSRYSAIGSVPLNRWTHWTVSINDKEIRIYINGVLDSSYTEIINIGGWSSVWHLGQRGNSTSWFKGKLDELRVYNRILTASEILALYRTNETNMNTSQATKYTDGLVGYWTFNGPDISNAYVYDRSGQGNNGYFSGVSTSSAKSIGKSGQGFLLDGTNDIVTVPDSASLDVVGAITLSAWIRTSGSNDYSGIIKKNTGLNGYQFGLGVGGVLRADFFDGVSYASPSSAVNVEDGEWHHVVATYDGTTARIYVDGAASGSTPACVGCVTVTTAPLVIGNDTCCGGRFFNGKIDEVRVYNRALSATEIKALYRLGK